MRPFVLRIGIALSCLICVLILSASPAHAAAGSLDPTFGQGGKVVASFGSPIVVANAALQSDGKILVLISNNESNFAIVRFLSNGSVDSSFGAGGFSQTIFANFNFPHSVSVQSNGTILVTGIATNDESHYEFVAARFNGDGSLDSTFGTGGQATAPVAGLLGQSISLIQPDGKILVAGSALFSPRLPTIMAMARFNSNGSLDRTFGTNGSFEQTSAVTFCSSLGLDSAGNIFVVAGSAIAEFTPNGGAKGQVTPAAIIASSQGGATRATAFQPDGKFVFAEAVFEGSLRQFDTDTKVVRFTATGATDPTFSNPTFDFAGEGGSRVNDVTAAVAILPNGQIMLGASHSAGGSTDELFALARLNPSGSLDPGFGSGGIVTTNVGGVEGVAALLVQTDGKIIAIGTANDFADVALVRYLGQ